MASTLIRAALGDFYLSAAYYIGLIRDKAFILITGSGGKDEAIMMPIAHYNAMVEDATRWQQLRLAAEQGKPSPFPAIALVDVPPVSRDGRWVMDVMTQDKAVRYAVRALTEEREQAAMSDERLANIDAATAVLNGMVGR